MFEKTKTYHRRKIVIVFFFVCVDVGRFNGKIGILDGISFRLLSGKSGCPA